MSPQGPGCQCRLEHDFLNSVSPFKVVLSFTIAYSVLNEGKSTFNLKMTSSYRYFSHQELRDLFTLEDPHHSKTQLQLDQMHSKHRKTDNELEKHIKFLHTLSE